MNKAYLLTFERNTLYDYNSFHNNIISNPTIKNWWHYMLNTYIIITPASPTELENLMIQYLPPNNNFLFFDVTDQDYGGWLPKAAWDWIKQYTR